MAAYFYSMCNNQPSLQGAQLLRSMVQPARAYCFDESESAIPVLVINILSQFLSTTNT